MNPIIAILKDIRPEFDFTESDELITEGMLDSFDIITLVAALDKKFSVSIEGTEIVPDNFRNVAAIASLLAKHGVTP